MIIDDDDDDDDNSMSIMLQTGDAPVCDPRTLYQCVLETQSVYVRDNEAANCNCARECRRLMYHPTISQSQLASSFPTYLRRVFNVSGSNSDIVNDYCRVEVRIYPRRLCRSTLVGFSSPSVCLSAAQFKNEWSQSVQTYYREWTTLGYTRSDIIWGWKVKCQGHRVNNTTQSHFISNYNRASSTFARWRYWQAIRRGFELTLWVHFSSSSISSTPYPETYPL